MKYIKTIIIILTVVIVGGCKKNIEKDNKISVKLEEQNTIGYQSGTDDEIIGMMADMTVDAKGNIYVADYTFKKVKMYSQNGKLIKVFGKGEGRGPGEFKEIRSIDVDHDGNLYVADMSRGVVVIFDSTGTLVKEFKPKMRPAYILANSLNEVYFLGFWNHNTEKILSKLDLTKDDPETSEIRFCDRYIGSDSWEVANVGFTGTILKDNEKNIYYTSFYPYYIRKYSSNCTLNAEFKRDVSFYEPPYIKEKNPLYVAPRSGSQTSALINNKYILNKIFRVDEDAKKYIVYLDVWDKNTGEFLGIFSEKELGIELSRYMFADEKGYLYNYIDEPFPQIKKYKINIEYIKK